MNAEIKYGNKKLYFIRHGKAKGIHSDFQNISFQKFISMMIHYENPTLNEENHQIPLPFPYKIDIIFPSSSQRSIKTAQLIQEKSLEYPPINYELANLLDEVKFSDGIIKELEFKERGGRLGCCPLILERWFNGEYVNEDIKGSLNRIHQLFTKILEYPFDNILFVSHAWYLRAVYLYLSNQQIDLENLLKAPRVSHGDFLKIENGYIDLQRILVASNGPYGGDQKSHLEILSNLANQTEK